MKKYFLILGMFLLTGPVRAHHPSPIGTDRPDAAESSEVVGKNHFQIETSFAFSHDRDAGVAERIYSFPTLFRYGIVAPLEFRLEGETFAVRTRTGQATDKGFTDLAFGAKLHLVDNERWVPSFGVLAHLTVPTGTSAFTSTVAEPIVKALFDWELPADFSLGTNLGFDVPVRDAQGDKFARMLYAVAVGHPLNFLSDRWRLFIEFAGAVPLADNKPDEHSFDSGIVWRINDTLQVDTLVQVGLSRTTPDITWGLGVSWRIL